MSATRVLCALLCLGATRAGAQSGGWRLAIELNGRPLAGGSVVARPDTLVLTVAPQDELGRPIPLGGYRAEPEDRGVLVPVGTTVERTRAVTWFVPGKRGRTRLQVKASGITQWIEVDVTERALGVTPVAAPPAQSADRGWATPVAGARLSYATYEYTFNQQTAIQGDAGFIGEVYAGLDYGYGVTMVGGFGFGVLGADSLGSPVNAQVVQLFFRIDYAFLSGKVVRPVVSAGGGAYRIRSGGAGAGIWNTSLSWTLGAGADLTLSPKLTGELRISTNLQEEINSAHQNGHVGNLLLIGAGVRYNF
jgi:hypothetical protein